MKNVNILPILFYVFFGIIFIGTISNLQAMHLMPSHEPIYYYEDFFDISEDANLAEIKAAYAEKISPWLPEKWAAAPLEKQKSAAENLKKYTDAYNILADPEKRELYDHYVIGRNQGFIGTFEDFLSTHASISKYMLSESGEYALLLKMIIAGESKEFKETLEDIKNYSNRTVLLVRDSNNFNLVHQSALFGQDACLEALLHENALVNAKSNDQKTPLHLAACYDELGKMIGITTAPWSTKCIKLLIDYGADINAGDIDGTTPLHMAAAYGHCDAIKLLVAKGANIDALDTDSGGEVSGAALHYAAYKGFKKIVEFLIALGAAVDIKNSKGQTPLDVTSDTDIKKLLQSDDLVASLQSLSKKLTAIKKGLSFLHQKLTDLQNAVAGNP